MHFKIIKALEGKSDKERFNAIIQWLEQHQINYELDHYQTGTNIILPSKHQYKIGLGSHYDVVPNTPGANDNASSISICLAIAKRIKEEDLINCGVEIYIFDEEETGLKGSSNYVKEYGIEHLQGYLNLEMVGQGNQFALWPLNQSHTDFLLNQFESTASALDIPTIRYDRLVTNIADHKSFRAAGLHNSFTVSCISEKDKLIAQEYYEGLERGLGHFQLFSILQQAPIFEHYHQSTDLAKHLSVSTLQMTENVIWQMIKGLKF